MGSMECTYLPGRQISLSDYLGHHFQLHLVSGIGGATSNADSVDVLEEVSQQTPTVVMDELRRLDVCAIKVSSETTFNL